MLTFLFATIEDDPLWEGLATAYPETLGRLIEQLAQTVQEHGGTVLKYITEGLCAVFPANNRQAILCALNLQQAVQQWTEPGSGEIRLQIALHAGEGKEIPLSHLEAYDGQSREYFGPTINQTAYLVRLAWGGQTIITQQALQQNTLPPGCQTRSLGEVPLKGAGETAILFQIDHPDLRYHRFPPLKTEQAASIRLPTFDIPFLGREQELHTVLRMLTQSGPRVVTIVGPGGAGKTRLAVQAAAELTHHFTHGVFYVHLGAIETVEGVVPAILEALNLHQYERLEASQQLFTYLDRRHLLLVLDNVEHLKGIEVLVHDMLNNAPRLRLLLTSRRQIDIQDSSIVPLSGFRAEDEQAAMQLFLACAQQVASTLPGDETEQEAIRRIVQLVDRLPLSIRLAATQTDRWSCTQIADLLRKNQLTLTAQSDTLPERQRSLNASLLYSWNLLSREEQTAIAALATLQDGFDTEAARSVAGVSIFMLRDLVRKSLLIQIAENRFRLLSGLQLFLRRAVLQPAEMRTSILQRRNTFYIERLLLLRRQNLSHDDRLRLLASLMHDLPNILAVWEDLSHALPKEPQAIQQILRMTGPLFDLLRARSRHREGERIFRHATSHLEAQTSLPIEAQQLLLVLQLRQAFFLIRLGRQEDARQLVLHARPRLRALKMQAELAWAHYLLALIAEADLDPHTTIHYAGQALRLYQTLGDIAHIGECQATLGAAHLRAWMHTEAQTHLLAALDAFQRLEDLDGMGRIYNSLGVLAVQQGDYTSAAEYFHRSLEVRKRTQNLWGIARLHNNLADVYSAQGNHRQAVRSLQQCVQISRDIGDAHMAAVALNNLAFHFWYYLHDYPTARRHYQQSLQFFKRCSAAGVAYTLIDLAVAACHQPTTPNEWQQARAWLLQATRQITALQAPAHSVLHALWGWACWHATQGENQQAFRLLSALQRDPIFQRRLAADRTLKALVESARHASRARLPAPQAAQIEQSPPSIEALWQTYETLARRGT